MGLMRRNRGRSAEPRSSKGNVPEFVDAAPARDAASMERYGYGTTHRSSDMSMTDDESMKSGSSAARRRFKKLFKKKKNKKKLHDGASVSSASAAKQWSPFRVSGTDFGENSLKFNKRNSQDRFRVMPDDAYPNTYLNHEEMKAEMNHKSAYYHDLRVPYEKGKEIGQLRLEVMQCFGLPSTSMSKPVSAYAIAVCGSHAFKTDMLPSSTNPMWLAQMRRACMFPINKAYDKIYLGVFDSKAEGNTSTTSDFIGRVVIDVARLRAGTMYDITLPLRQSAHVFTRNQQGAIRVRMHLIWVSERAAVLSYLPTSKPKFVPDEKHKINCLDEKSFRNVAQLVHGRHMPGKFSMTLLKSTMREMDFTRIHIFRYIRRREIYNLRFWVYPAISAFVFCAWMHSVYFNTLRYVPGHILTYFLLLLYMNYAHYAMDSPIQNGFTGPTIEELFNSLLYGTKGRRQKYIEALNMESDAHCVDPEDHIEFELENSNPADKDISVIAEAMRRGIKTQNYKYRLQTYKDAFQGNDAVDFLTSNGYAYSRAEAVQLARRMAKDLFLFEAVGSEDDLRDEPAFYHFLDVEDSHAAHSIKGHQPKFRNLFRSLGLVNSNISRKHDHVEFPFSDGRSHPRFTVKQALLVSSNTSKKMTKEREEAREIVDCAEFGVAPALQIEEQEEEGDGASSQFFPAELVKTGIRRGSIVASATLNAATNLPQNIMNLPQNITNINRRRSMEFGDPTELYGKLKQRHNPSLDELLESRKLNDSHYDQYCYESDDDVESVVKKRKKGSMIEEKILAKPPNQEISRNAPTSGQPDKPFFKNMMEIRHRTHGLMGHLFNDRVYKIDPALFPPEHKVKDEGSSAKGKRGLFGRNKTSHEDSDDDDEEGKNKDRTPYDARVEQYDKILQIHKYSHSNPWINRVAVVVQPIIEILQVGLFASRAGYNIMTWQDPILSFWIALVGTALVFVFHFMPYRLVFFLLGIYLVGPQNWLYRLFQESKPGYKPPSFDVIVKKKPVHKNEPYKEIQLFSSMAPGNQHIKFKNVDPQQVKQVIVPNSVLKYSRFYDWPPEPEYARVYKAPPPRNLNTKSKSSASFDIMSHDSGDRNTSDSEGEEQVEDDEGGEDSKRSYWYDATLARTKKKKKKKGLKKVTHNVKKGAGVVVGTTVEAGGALTGAVVGVTGAVVGTTLGATIGVAKATGKATKMAVDGAINAGSYVGEGLRKSGEGFLKPLDGKRRSGKLTRGLNKDEYEDEEYNDYY